MNNDRCVVKIWVRESEENEKGRELGGQNRSNPPIQQHAGQQLFHNIDNDCFIISTTIVPKLKVRSEGPYGVSELFGKANRGSRRWVGVRAGQHRVGVQLLRFSALLTYLITDIVIFPRRWLSLKTGQGRENSIFDKSSSSQKQSVILSGVLYVLLECSQEPLNTSQVPLREERPNSRCKTQSY